MKLAGFIRTYDQLGPIPPVIDFRRNDSENSSAHTLARHSHSIPLRRDPGRKTIEGRIYGDGEWGRRETQSFRWDSETVMTDEVNAYIARNWETIRVDLALTRKHRQNVPAGHRVGEGFFNGGLDSPGSREAIYKVADMFRITVNLVPNADPAKAFVVTAHPVGLLR